MANGGGIGWKCCKKRVLTFEEFMDIPPCTEGLHSTQELSAIEDQKNPEIVESCPTPKSQSFEPTLRNPIPAARPVATPLPSPETEEDEPDINIPDGKICRRRACHQLYRTGQLRNKEKCVFHPGEPIFHEGSKGYSCCKRRVLEFDQFLKIQGCQTKNRHLFVGNCKVEEENKVDTDCMGTEVILNTVRYVGTLLSPQYMIHRTNFTLKCERHDFYQTLSTVVASIFLKNICKEKAKVEFNEDTILLDLVTMDPVPKHLKAAVPLYGKIDAQNSSFKIFRTKLELLLTKDCINSWPVLRRDEQLSGEIIQVGQAGRAY